MQELRYTASLYYTVLMSHQYLTCHGYYLSLRQIQLDVSLRKLMNLILALCTALVEISAVRAKIKSSVSSAKSLKAVSRLVFGETRLLKA